MNLPYVLQQALGSKAIHQSPGLPAEQLDALLAMHAILLPESHRALLRASDGITAYGGYFRVFGAQRLWEWNDQRLWKFAWPDAVADFVCFGETGWGDQYAYRADELRRDHEPRVYFLEAITLRPELLHESFEAFLAEELLRNAVEPYDAMLVEARKRIGDLRLEEHIQYVPSPLISGEELIETVAKVPAVTSMVINGDLSRQLAAEEHSRAIKGVETYQDENGRTRLRVVW